jgi:small conductance mechanosensitive channel
MEAGDRLQPVVESWHSPCVGLLFVDPELAAQVEAFVRVYLIPTAWKLLGAIALWMAGRWVIKLVRTALGSFLKLRQLDTTLASYVEASAGVLLQVLLFIAVLGVLGIETTSFAALLAATGLAIGAAWAGLLSNFAAGVFLLVFRPFKVGDTIAAVGVTGTVREIGMFVTSVITADNVVTYIGNNRLFSENVQNFSASPFRRVDLTVQLLPGTDSEAVIMRLRRRLRQIPHLLDTPVPIVEILSFNVVGTSVAPVLAVRPFCRNEHYMQVYFDTTRAIQEICVHVHV